MLDVVCPPDHEYEYGPVPPLAVADADPVLAPQLVFVLVVDVVIAAGCVIETVCEETHPDASVTVHVYVPAESPVAVAAVPPVGVHE